MSPSRRHHSLALLATFLLTLLAVSGSHASAAPTIHPGDTLGVTVFNHDNLSGQVTVSASGEITLPLAHAIPVGGLDETAASRRVATAFKPYLQIPSVDVRILQQAQSIFFTGATLGVQAYQPGETLAVAVATATQKLAPPPAAGAPSPSALDLRHVRLERDGTLLGSFNLEDLAQVGDPGPSLQPGDVIAIANKPIRVDVRGDIKSPGPTYLDAGDPLSEALAEAGGLSPTTSASTLVLHRDNTDTVISAASPEIKAPARNGDILTLQPAPRVLVVGQVATPGEVVLKNSPSLLAALYLAGGPTKWARLSSLTISRHGQTISRNISGLVHGDVSSDVPLHDGDVVFVPEGHKIDLTSFAQAINALASAKYLVK